MCFPARVPQHCAGTYKGVAAAALGLLLLSGCMVGPKYVKPTVPLAPNYKEESGAGSDAY